MTGADIALMCIIPVATILVAATVVVMIMMVDD